MSRHAEIRGRNRSWKVWTPNPANAPHPVPFYDQDGNLKETLLVGSGGETKMVETYGGPFSSIEEATEYARYLGYDEVKVVRPLTREQALAKARAARQR
jgi:hypothetical protein